MQGATGNPYHYASIRVTSVAGQVGAGESGKATHESHIVPRPDEAPPDHASLQEVERWLRLRRTESAYGFDPATGTKVWERHTDGMEIPLEPIDREHLRGMIFTHNHPQGWLYPEDDPRRLGTSFSPHDIQSAALAGMTELRAVAPGFLFTIRPADGGRWPAPNHVALMFDMVKHEVARQMPHAVRSGTMDGYRDRRLPMLHTRSGVNSHR